MWRYRQIPKHFNNLAINELPLFLIFYHCAAPLVWVTWRLGISANQVTLVSLLAGVGSFVALLAGSAHLFVTLWAISYLLDFVDGPLARLTETAVKFIVRKDHVSDIFRISLIPAGFGFFYDSQIVWMASFLATFGFLFYSWVNNAVGKNQGQSPEKSNPLRPATSNATSRFLSWIFDRTSRVGGVARPFLIIHGHTFLLYFFVPFSESAGTVLLTYIGSLSMTHAARILWKARRIVDPT